MKSRRILLSGIIALSMAFSVVACSGKEENSGISKYMEENNVAGEYATTDGLWALNITKDYFSIYDPVGNPGVEGKILSMDDKKLVVEVDMSLFEGLPEKEWKLSGENFEVEYERTKDTIKITNSGVTMTFVNSECGDEESYQEIETGKDVKTKAGNSLNISMLVNDDKNSGEGSKVQIQYTYADGNKQTTELVDAIENLGKAYLLESEDENYLLLETFYANDYANTFFFEIDEKGISNKGSIAGSIASTTQGNSFVIGMRINVLGTYSSESGYTIVDGEIVPTDNGNVHTVNMADFQLTTKKDFEITDYEGKKVTVKAGSKFVIYMWNADEKYLEVEANYKDECIQGTLDYEQDEAGQFFIDGVSEYELFEKLPYAG